MKTIFIGIMSALSVAAAAATNSAGVVNSAYVPVITLDQAFEEIAEGDGVNHDGLATIRGAITPGSTAASNSKNVMFFGSSHMNNEPVSKVSSGLVSGITHFLHNFIFSYSISPAKTCSGRSIPGWWIR